MPEAELVTLCDGSRDVAVGISGFGSAKVPPSRWQALCDITGRSTFVVKYESQRLPSVAPVGTYIVDLVNRWRKAHAGAEVAAQMLREQVEDWIADERRVLLVGFSLGGWVAWNAVKDIKSPLIDVVLIAGAVHDHPDSWGDLSQIGSLVNVYSNTDAVLWGLYPLGAGSGSTPAAGLGPLSVSGENVWSLDATDVIGRKHLVPQEKLDRLMLAAVTTIETGRAPIDLVEPATIDMPSKLDAVRAYRLQHWMVGPALEGELVLALRGDRNAIATCVVLDEWSLVDERLAVLMDLGHAHRALDLVQYETPAISASKRELEQMLMVWLERFGPSGQ